MPEQYQTIERDTIVHNMNSIKATTKSKCCIFQTTVTLGWNPQSDEATKLLIPPVSLRDEIKTTGYGMAVIELLCLVGIYDEEKVSDTITNWGLDMDGKQRHMFLCIDVIHVYEFPMEKMLEVMIFQSNVLDRWCHLGPEAVMLG